MPLLNTKRTYGAVARALHWWMAALMIALVCLGLYMTEQPDGDAKWALYDLHKSLGTTLFALLVLRIFWRAYSPPPSMPSSMSYLEQSVARYGHFLLYLCMFALPVSGYLDSSLGGYHISVFGWFEVPMLLKENKPLGEIADTIHTLLAYGLILLVVAHAGAAFKHHFVQKDDVLRRMLGK